MKSLRTTYQTFKTRIWSIINDFGMWMTKYEELKLKNFPWTIWGYEKNRNYDLCTKMNRIKVQECSTNGVIARCNKVGYCCDLTDYLGMQSQIWKFLQQCPNFVTLCDRTQMVWSSSIMTQISNPITLGVWIKTQHLALKIHILIQQLKKACRDWLYTSYTSQMRLIFPS